MSIRSFGRICKGLGISPKEFWESHHHYTPKLDDAEWVGIFRRLKALFSEAEAAAWVDRWERLAGAKRLDDAQNIMELVALGMGAKRRETPSEPRSRRS